VIGGAESLLAETNRHFKEELNFQGLAQSFGSFLIIIRLKHQERFPSASRSAIAIINVDGGISQKNAYFCTRSYAVVDLDCDNLVYFHLIA